MALTYPGVYIEELPSGVRTIAGVGTSIALFVGRTTQGPLNAPVRCQTLTDFGTTFSWDDPSGDLPRAVRLFFANGGSDCYVMRIASGAHSATVTLNTEASAGAPAAFCYSQAGRPMAPGDWQNLIGTNSSTNKFRVSVDGQAFTEVDLSAINVGAMTPAQVATAVAGAINPRLPVGSTVTVD